jgi:hypothetical protein
MIGMSEEDPTHGMAVTDGCLSMPISASSALAVWDVGGGVDPRHGRRRLPPDAVLESSTHAAMKPM